MGKQLKQVFYLTERTAMGCCDCFDLEFQFSTGYHSFGVPVHVPLLFLIQNLHTQQYDLSCPEIPSHKRLADELPGQPTAMIFDLMSAITKGMPMPTDTDRSPNSYISKDHQSTTLQTSLFT